MPVNWFARRKPDSLGAAANPQQQDARFAASFGDEIRQLRPDLKVRDDPLKSIYQTVAADKTGLSALCISGGGIRSASFALGILQCLAENKLLGEFDYMSTVSGGGYIGSFLSAWRKQLNGAIPPGLTARQDGREAPELAALRAGSNYLTPRTGVLSADTWTAMALIIRNLLLNWAIFLPFFMAVLLIPWFCRHLLAALPHAGLPPAAGLVGGAALLCFGLCCASYGRRRAMGKWLTERRFLVTVMLPVVLASMCFTAAARSFVAVNNPAGIPFGVVLIAFATGAASYFLAWCIATLCLNRGGHTQGEHIAYSKWQSMLQYAGDVLVWAGAGGLSGATLAWCLCQLATLGPGPLAVGGIVLTMLALFAGELVYVALRSYDRRGDMDREWLARSAGWLTAAAISWAVLAATALYGPLLQLWGKSAIAAAGGVSGLFTLVIGGSANTAATDAAKIGAKLTFTQLTAMAALVFAFCLSVFVATLDVALGHAIREWLHSENLAVLPLTGGALHGAGPFERCASDLVCGVGLFLFSFGLSYFVNVNRFSLHGLYRNRLVRTFLGSARMGPDTNRRPDPFTRFDPADNPDMHELRMALRPLHIVNVALNVVFSTNLAWQERKAVSFTISPLHAGCPLVGYRRAQCYGGPRGGISLGTAMAISGAAVSPNMGYHTSRLTSFLLMLFNVRLGCWLGNPAGPDYGCEGPRFGLLTMLQELANLTTADGRWVYLSDGGHFDNLGLYEMLRRRCRLIVVSDAGCDPNASLADLGDALRKAAIDFGVKTDFSRLAPNANKRPPVVGPYCWVADVTYADGEKGQIVYLRPTYTAAEPADVRSYAEADPTFPHDTTTEQWFGERQFEAYRALGQRQMDVICAVAIDSPPSPTAPLDSLVAKARKHIEMFH
jgi:hypothetical protein